MIKVSVIIPVYNTENYLRKCLDSICNQTLSDIEIICINDCSKDNSLEILKQYSYTDKRIKLINLKENKGVSFVRNTGIDKAHGKYIGFVDSDDFIDLDFYNKLYNKAIEKKANVVKGNIYNCDEKGKNPTLTEFYNMNDKIRKNKAYFYYGFTSAIYKKTFLSENNIYFPNNIAHFEDPYFSIKVAISMPMSTLSFDDSARYFYRKHKESACLNSKTLKKTQDFVNSIYKILEVLNNSHISEKEYYIFLSFLYKMIKPWCYDIHLPKEANLIAQNALITLLKNKYGIENFLKFYFNQENYFTKLKLINNNNHILQILRKKVTNYAKN